MVHRMSVDLREPSDHRLAGPRPEGTKPTFENGGETIKAFANRRALMRELRKEARGSGRSWELATRVRKLGKLETPDQPGREP